MLIEQLNKKKLVTNCFKAIRLELYFIAFVLLVEPLHNSIW